MRHYRLFSGPLLFAFVPALFLAYSELWAAQEPASAPAAAQSSKASAEKQPELPAQIQLLETKVRFEANGDSRKKVHTLVHINNELGVRQFARLNFDYNRSFQQVELPLMRITHASGGTADILPGSVSDQPNPAVVNFPAYQDVRVKSVRILGLEPGDTLEYRVVTTTTHHPLAPDFWLDHTFDRSGVVSQEIFELDLPTCRFEEIPQTQSFDVTDNDPLGIVPPGPPKFDPDKRPRFGEIRVSPNSKEISRTRMGQGTEARLVYKWNVAPLDLPKLHDGQEPDPDVMVTTFRTWGLLARRLDYTLFPYGRPFNPPKIRDALVQISRNSPGSELIEAIYDFVSQKIKTVELPLGSTGFKPRPAEEVLSSGYGTNEEKVELLLALIPNQWPKCDFLLLTSAAAPANEPPRPSIISHLLVRVENRSTIYLDPGLEMAPFGMVPAALRGKQALLLESPGFGWMYDGDNPRPWVQGPVDLPFAATQHVSIEAKIGTDGALTARVHYSMRGDNELLLRLAFHQAPKEKWKEVAQLLALSDGFRGKVTNVTASDPYATKEPFTVEYEITQPKFVDWSKRPVRIPAILPLMALPDMAKPNGDSAPGGIELGTPLDVQTRVTLRVPPDTSIRAPAGISVDRGYATFSSEYSARNLTLTAERRINFLQRKIPAANAADYAAFVHAVQNDQAQEFTLERAGSASAAQTVNSKISGPAAAAKP